MLGGAKNLQRVGLSWRQWYVGAQSAKVKKSSEPCEDMFLYQLYRRLSIKAAQLISLHGRIAPAIVIMLSAVSAQAQIAQTPDGYWQHPEDPVWIEVLLQAGTGIALRNDDQPETVGFHVVKDLAATDEPGIWQGQVFVPQLDGYKKVTITMPDDQTLRMTVKFGFLRRSVDWSRVGEREDVGH